MLSESVTVKSPSTVVVDPVNDPPDWFKVPVTVRLVIVPIVAVIVSVRVVVALRLVIVALGKVALPEMLRSAVMI